VSTPLRVVAVVRAPLGRVERATRDLAPDVRSHLVETPAGVLLTLERDGGWRRRTVLRELEAALREVTDELG